MDIDNEMVKVQRRVRFGVEWLDRQLGPDWPQLIDPFSLDIRLGESCVLGQLAEALVHDFVHGFADVVGERGDPNYLLDMAQAVERGFEMDCSGPMLIAYQDPYDLLENEWCRIIRLRTESP
jgi:hypothetical protein